MWFGLTDEQKLLQQTVRRAAQEKMAPLVAEIDQKNHENYDSIRNFVQELGLLALIIPKEYGGPGGNLTSACIVAEELGKVIPAAAAILGGHYLAIDCIEAGAKEDIRSRYLTKFATGKYLAAICLTEPEAGSDAAAIKTKAVKQGDQYVLNGRKCFITSGGMADILSVFAITTPGKGAKGIPLFVVDMKVTTDVVQIFGGYGYMRDYPVERMMRDAKLTQIFDGTNQIHRMVIASSIFHD